MGRRRSMPPHASTAQHSYQRAVSPSRNSPHPYTMLGGGVPATVFAYAFTFCTSHWGPLVWFAVNGSTQPMRTATKKVDRVTRKSVLRIAR